eukprot:Lankesteria_metandrocarpae@DN631_c0_g1_i1.p2
MEPISEKSSRLKEDLKQLAVDRQKMESEMSSLLAYLNSEGMPGVNSPLVDREGFPRADIDIYAVRTARQRNACLTTDLREVSDKMQKMLIELHSIERTVVPRNVAHTPFAFVARVDAASPAEKAGLLVGDCVVEFGSLKCPADCSTGESPAELFSSLPNIVQKNKGVKSSVVVCRRMTVDSPLTLEEAKAGLSAEGTQVERLTLTPEEWGGKGLLGCHMLPF